MTTLYYTTSEFYTRNGQVVSKPETLQAGDRLYLNSLSPVENPQVPGGPLWSEWECQVFDAAGQIDKVFFKAFSPRATEKSVMAGFARAMRKAA